MTSTFLSRVLILALAIVFISLPGQAISQVNKTVSYNIIDDLSKTEKDILSYINEYRAKKGLQPLEMNAEISAEAAKHSVGMANNKVAFGHDGFEDRVKNIRQKIGTVRSSAENVAFGNMSARQVVDGWIKSPGHRKNIEGDFKLTGIGVANSKDNVLYFTQIFTNK